VRGLGDRATIIDGGSNIGMSVLFFKWLWPSARIDAFEPGTQTFQCLRELVDTNKLTDVQIHNCALAADNGPLTFYSDPAQPGSLRMSLIKTRMPKTEQTVVGEKLSERIQQPIDLLKLDIEGAEVSVIHELASAGKLKFIKNMVIEYHHHIDADKNDLSEFLRCIEHHDFGYQLRASFRPPFRSRTFQDVLIYAYRANYSGGAE
jgi:FkbM family methyltransferase